MASPWHGQQPPYTLPSNIVYFHDWRYVSTGGFRWVSQTGEHVPVWTLDPVPPMRLDYIDMPLGIHLEARRATKSEPILRPEQAHELFLFAGTLIHEDGRYRLWYDCWPGEHFDRPQMGQFNYVRYAESDNGLDWRLPTLGLVERFGTRDNNIVYGPPLTPRSGYHGGCVFKDSSAPPHERYKSFYLGLVPPDVLAEQRRTRPDAIDAFAVQGDTAYGLYGATSPDGLRWTPIPEPLVVQGSDTHNVCEYDERLGKYVSYCRTWYFNRRAIGRMEASDFRHFPLPEELIWPNAMMQPYELWYANGKTRMPGAPDYHVMFPMRWSLPEDKFDFHLATSPDNITWGFVPGGPVCEKGDPGAWDGGLVAPGLGMVNLPGDRMGILLAGSAVPHKHPRRPPLGALGWAWWPKGRLVALCAPLEGSFATWPLVFRGRAAHLNFKTSITGFVQVEAVDGNGQVLPGRSIADCDMLCGDALDRAVSWHGQTDLGHTDGAPVVLRFRLRNAELYSVEFRM